jgi:hypothetical protein
MSRRARWRHSGDEIGSAGGNALVDVAGAAGLIILAAWLERIPKPPGSSSWMNCPGVARATLQQHPGRLARHPRRADRWRERTARTRFTERAGDTANEASVSSGPSALLGAILAGREPADAVLRAPAEPFATPLSRSGQARRPLATVFNEEGSSFQVPYFLRFGTRTM